MKKRQSLHGKICKNAPLKIRQLALVLAVSLWMAAVAFWPHSVAEAQPYYLYLNAGNGNALTVDEYTTGTTTRKTGEAAIAWINTLIPGATVTTDGTTLTVKDGTSWTDWYMFGGYPGDESSGYHGDELSDYKLMLENVENPGGDIRGAWSRKTATNNVVTLTGSTVGSVYGGYVDYNYGSNNDASATNNKVIIKNSTVGSVHGGYIVCNHDSNNHINATGNKVIIENSTVNGDVYGGWVDHKNGNSNFVDNQVLLQGGVHVTGDVWGGFTNRNYKDISNNTLHLSGTTAYPTNTVGRKIWNFNAICIDSAVWGKPVLKLTKDIGSYPPISTEGITFSGVAAVKAAATTPLIEGGMNQYAGDENIISGSTYKVGSTLQGKGHAYIDGSDLKFFAETSVIQEQTHNTVMSAEVGMAALSAGNDFVGAATEGLAMTANVGADGVSSFANMGGGSIRQETGSHIDAHTWNAIIALGHQNKKERGTMEYGAFFEYGTGNYSMHNGDERGDGSTHYTGGGLLAKYTMKNNVYVEGSLRAGSVHDDARNVLRDVNGVPYSYETNAPYMGFHLGVGKEIAFDDIHSLDVYGKYFYNRRNGVSFDAGGHYDLDAVTSSVIRIGARYTVKRDKWKFYGGLAYEHELDGKATGTADGMEIRGADTSGGSLRGEIGATMKPGENSPITLDFNVTGFAGKKQGFSGGVSVAFMF